MAEYYLGVISDIYTDNTISREYHLALVDVPALGNGLKAFPKCGCLDEPKKGDPVLCLDLDPLYHSYIIYEKLKEDDIIGFRSSGKEVIITPEFIKLGVYSTENSRNGENSDSVPDSKVSSIEMDKDGNIKINATKDITVTVSGDVKIDAAGKIIMNGGYNGGLVNIESLKTIIKAIRGDLLAARSPCLNMLLYGNAALKNLEDTDIKH